MFLESYGRRKYSNVDVYMDILEFIGQNIEQ